MLSEHSIDWTEKCTGRGRHAEGRFGQNKHRGDRRVRWRSQRVRIWDGEKWAMLGGLSENAWAFATTLFVVQKHLQLMVIWRHSSAVFLLSAARMALHTKWNAFVTLRSCSRVMLAAGRSVNYRGFFNKKEMPSCPGLRIGVEGWRLSESWKFSLDNQWIDELISRRWLRFSAVCVRVGHWIESKWRVINSL